MDRLTQLRGEAGGSQDCTLDISSPPSEAYMTANESSASKFYSLTEDDSTFDITPIKDVSLASAADPDKTTETDELMSNLSPIPKKSELLDSYKFGKQIEAANILSGGVEIFDDNDNSYDGDELVIDDNVVEIDEKSNHELKLTETGLPEGRAEEMTESTLVENETIASKDTEVVLQIDGKNVNAIDIGNGLYLYRKEGEEELAAVQIIDDDQQQPSFKFLKVRENAEGNLEVYEEIEIEVPKEVPAKEGKTAEKNVSHVPIKDINKVISDSTCNKVAERMNKLPQKELEPATSTTELEVESKKDTQTESNKTEVNLNGKMMKFNETRKSPFIHSTPNKEGIPLTKTMVDLQLHPTRHSDNVKTIEVHTDSCKQRVIDKHLKNKDLPEDSKSSEITVIDKEKEESIENSDKIKVEETKQSEKVLFEIDKKENEGTHVLEIAKSDKQCLEKNGVMIENQCDKVLIDQSLNPEINEVTPLERVDYQKPVTLEKIKPVAEESKNEEIGQKCSSINQESDKINIEANLKNSDDKGDAKNVLPLNDLATNKSVQDNMMEIDKADMVICVKDDNDNGNTDINKPSQLLKPEKEKQEKSPCQETQSTKKETQEILPNRELVSQMSSTIDTTKQKVIKDSVNKNDVDIVKNKVKVNEVNSHLTAVRNEVGPQENQADSNITAVSVIPMKAEAIHKEVATDLQSNNSAEVKLHKVEFADKKIQDKKLTPVSVKKSSLEFPTKSKELDSKLLITEKDKSESVHLNKIDEKQSIKTDISAKIGNKQITHIKVAQNKTDVKKEVVKVTMEQKSVNNNHAAHAAVPFGKWTEANRQEYMNKIKETKVPASSTNTKQIKQPNDLNRRDVLQKIDSQRQSNSTVGKVQDMAINKLNVKNETKTFTSKPTVSQDSKLPKTESLPPTNKPVINKKILKQEVANKILKDLPNTTFTTSSLPNTTFSTSSLPNTVFSTSTVTKKETIQRKEINNQDLIDKTIEGIINRPVKNSQEDTKPNTTLKEPIKIKKDSSSYSLTGQTKEKQQPTALDAIEMKMNELHGIPFVERPAHELPQVFNHDLKTYSKNESPKATANKISKIPNLLPFANKSLPKVTTVVELDSEEEIIEHEPVTGDIEIPKKSNVPKPTMSGSETKAQVSTDISKKEAIITEKDFDKFARRNSITYENYLTVNFEGNQSHNVVQTVVEKDIPPKKYSRNEMLLAEAKVKSSQKQLALHTNKNPNKIQITSKLMPVNNDTFKNYQSKLQLAYQTALTAKRHMESPITIIEDKPVKVVFMDAHSEFMPSQLNAQGKELSPAKKVVIETDVLTTSTCDSMDSDMLETIDSGKREDSKSKTKHQRKQVLTPVETPDLELIEPSDLGVELSPKKKRRTEDIKTDRSPKILVPKKSYLLGRSPVVDDNKASVPQDLSKNPLKETIIQSNTVVSHKDAASAIDNLVKAAELLETQSENLNTTAITINSDSQSNTPVKRGRGRPRKYPLPEGPQDNKVPTPQKKPRLIDAKKPKPDTESEEEDTSDDEMVKENWTMGKINEDIVCPICNKLFRSENVVFKHVKHCTGPSPNRSDSDKRSPRRSRQSLESESKSRESKSDDMDFVPEQSDTKKDSPKKRKSKESFTESKTEKDDIVVIEDLPSTEKLDRNRPKQHESRKRTTESKVQYKTSNLSCEVCGKTFRQLSYLVNHKLQHKKEDTKKTANDDRSEKPVFSCEVCKKEFRKLHHLVQHRIIHNPSNVPSRPSRKSSYEQSDNKIDKDHDTSKSEDQSAAFRCEPCDKSFRKLHHLVEHRETHEQTEQKNNTTTQNTVDKATPTVAPPQCDICKKTFRKLHHLIEHKEQHLETSSEKSDDKSVKSALSTKDIIHECSLCYMVFPNEHSLNKHSVICQRKKRQSAAKQPTPAEETDITENDNELAKIENNLEAQSEPTIERENESEDNPQTLSSSAIQKVEVAKIINNRPSNEIDIKIIETKTTPKKRDSVKSDDSNVKLADIASEIPSKIKKNDDKSNVLEIIEVIDTPNKQTPKKKISVKDKIAPTVTKRKKSTNLPLPVIDENTVALVSSDDEDVRYMLNPNFKVEDTNEGKMFMKVRAKKRNSLQIERPNSKDLVKRRTSLQHPPKIPRLKPKLIEAKVASTSITKSTKLVPVPSTDSDDSDIKYSFPKNIGEKAANVERDLTSKEKRKSLKGKRKSLSGIAKRKSLGKPVASKPKAQVKPSPLKQIKRRIAEVEHRCDCGQLFSSAALLSRHTTLAHTPPRIRRRRSPPPEIITKTVNKKQSPRKTVVSEKPKPSDSRKSSVRSDVSSNSKPANSRKSILNKSEPKTPSRKSKAEGKSTVKTKRTAAHKGVPVPEKMKKLFEKYKK